MAGGKPRDPRHRPSDDEVALWREAMRDAKPLADRDRISGEKSRGPKTALPDPTRAPDRPESRIAAPAPSLIPAAGLDKRTAERLRRGRLPIEARLDLHGMTQREAHRALIDFVEGGHRNGRRCLLVITGRGTRSGDDDYGRPRSGVLREAVPQWLRLEPLRGRILSVATARRQHGGEGALYVLLRRRRPAKD